MRCVAPARSAMCRGCPSRGASVKRSSSTTTVASSRAPSIERALSDAERGRQAPGHNRPMFLTLPTLLTWARIAAIPLLAGVFHLPLDAPTRNVVATSLFIVFALTDWLDGWLARRL